MKGMQSSFGDIIDKLCIFLFVCSKQIHVLMMLAYDILDFLLFSDKG